MITFGWIKFFSIIFSVYVMGYMTAILKSIEEQEDADNDNR